MNEALNHERLAHQFTYDGFLLQKEIADRLTNQMKAHKRKAPKRLVQGLVVGLVGGFVGAVVLMR
jgi:hypothetical protein